MRLGTADAYPFKTQSAPLRFAIACGLIAAAFAIDRLGGASIDDGSLFLLLGTAVMASAWFAGTGPALGATVLGAFIGATHGGATASHSAAASMHLALFVMQGLLLTGLVAELRAARRTAVHQAQEAQEARRRGDAANRMKDEFLATISHELRTPLNAVLGWVHLLRTGKLDPSTSSRGLASVERNVRLQAQLTSDLLDVSKALTGRLKLECRPTVLTEAVREAIRAVAPAARAKAVAVEASLPDNPLVVLGDVNRLRHVAWHLLANAIKFTPRGGAVQLTVAASDDEVWLTVQDGGDGIEPGFLPHVFEHFTQADSSTTRSAGGLGVGLALVRELVELHGGAVEARNREDGPGAVFTVRFPRQPIEAEAGGGERTRAPMPSLEGAPLDGVRVLVLDHDQDARDLLGAVLQQRGATVRSVDSVGEALELLEGWHPDVLISDNTSPDRESYALIGRVHSLDAARGGRIPALALTAAARSDERLVRLLTGVQRDFPKPIEPALLTAEIARLTGRERRRARR